MTMAPTVTETETAKREKQRISLFVDTLSPVNYKGLHQDYQETSACLLVTQVNQTTIL